MCNTIFFPFSKKVTIQKTDNVFERPLYLRSKQLYSMKMIGKFCKVQLMYVATKSLQQLFSLESKVSTKQFSCFRSWMHLTNIIHNKLNKNIVYNPWLLYCDTLEEQDKLSNIQPYPFLHILSITTLILQMKYILM